MKVLTLIFTLFNLSVFSQSPVLLELFTSQGYSSCPPADRVLAEIKQDKNLENVFVLSYHVDYWDRLGWKDPYASAKFSERQRWYAAKLNDRVYTPELIVNGKTGIVGSRKGEINRLIEETIKEPNANSLRVIDSSQLLLQYDVQNPGPDVKLCAAFYTDRVENQVSGGENSGRELSHVNVVRTLKTYRTNSSGTIQLDIPEKGKVRVNGVICFLQNQKTGEILSAVNQHF